MSRWFIHKNTLHLNDMRFSTRKARFGSTSRGGSQASTLQQDAADVTCYLWSALSFMLSGSLIDTKKKICSLKACWANLHEPFDMIPNFSSSLYRGLNIRLWRKINIWATSVSLILHCTKHLVKTDEKILRINVVEYLDVEPFYTSIFLAHLHHNNSCCFVSSAFSHSGNKSHKRQLWEQIWSYKEWLFIWFLIRFMDARLWWI